MWSIWIEAQTYGHLRGDNFHLQEYLGAHKETGRTRILRVWAPNAQAVDLIEDFTGIGKPVKFQWFCNEGGVWESLLFRCKRGRYIQYLVTDKYSSGKNRSSSIMDGKETQYEDLLLRPFQRKTERWSLEKARRKNLF